MFINNINKITAEMRRKGLTQYADDVDYLVKSSKVGDEFIDIAEKMADQMGDTSDETFEKINEWLGIGVDPQQSITDLVDQYNQWLETSNGTD